MLLKEYGKIAGTFSRRVAKIGDGVHGDENIRKIEASLYVAGNFIAVRRSGGGSARAGLAGVMGNKALLMINGGDQQTVPVRQALDGVKVLSIQGDQVMLVAERAHACGAARRGVGGGDGSGKIMMTADAQGAFFYDGNHQRNVGSFSGGYRGYDDFTRGD